MVGNIWTSSNRRILTLAVLAVGMALVHAQDTETVRLPPPQLDRGKSLMQALAQRRSSRAFSDREIGPQVLANLLWAAFGVNRPASGRRTAPSAVNWQEIDIYVAQASGVYLFDARHHALKRVLAEDIRTIVGLQDFTRDAPVTLIYVADFARMGKASMADKVFYSATDTGFVSQNVYLFCASENLATVVIGLVDRAALGRKLELRETQRVILAQPVGYPAR